jgi:hypothetical protein
VAAESQVALRKVPKPECRSDKITVGSLKHGVYVHHLSPAASPTTGFTGYAP